MKTTNWIWQSGNWVAWDDAKVHVSTHALHYGSSAFEGLRAYSTPEGPAVLCLKSHIDRLFHSAKIARMEVPYTPEEITQVTLDVVRRNQLQSCYIRPLVFRGTGAFGLEGRGNPTEVVVFAIEWGRYLGAEGIEKGINAMVSSWRRMAQDTMPALAKIGGQYINSQFIAMEARDNGFDEGLCLDTNGYVSEGSGENIFLVIDGIIYTPALSSSILGGITRRCVFELADVLGYEIKEMMIPREMLYIADEIFLTGTAAEITPVRSVDRIQVGKGERGPITKRIQDHFFGITSGKMPDRFGWLTPVYVENVANDLVRSFDGR
ncbi:MAG TPA: branched-chain amino acid transaminase [Aggregatilineaceae bacterium]|nr:branched-chain amino acid transaminase [Aggregatilineaceae bacterium]